MEFKGTIGKWEITPNWEDEAIEIGTKDQPACALIEKNWFSNEGEAKANALLISKAPEMLEMLNKLYSQDLLKDCEQEVLDLIKSATKL